MKLLCTCLCALLFLSGSLCAQSKGRKATAPSGQHDPELTERDIETMQAATEALRANQTTEAIAGFQELTRDAPRFAGGYLNLGLALSSVARNQEAVAALERAVALQPNLRGAHLFLAIANYRLNRLEAAAAAIRKETALNPNDAQAWMWQGIIDLGLSKLTLAVEDLDRASSLDPKNVDILYHRGRAALALSRDSYETMFRIDPKSWHVHQVVAQANAESDHDADAIEQYKLAIAAAPPQSGLYEALGSSLWRTGKFQEAEKAFEEALKIDPNDVLTMYKLGSLRVDRGDAAGGKPLLDRVAVLDPSLKLSKYYLGRADAELGNDQMAVQEFLKVISENADADTTKQAYFQLSRVYRRLHDPAAAAAAAAEYRRLDQINKDALQEKLAQQSVRADRDTRIPAPTQPDAPQ